MLVIRAPFKTKILFVWTIAALLSLALTAIMAEFALRYSSIRPVPPRWYLTGWSYLMEHPERFRDQHDKFGYEPFSQNRQVAVFTDYHRAWVEFDVTFTTNNAGLVQQGNIDPSKRYTVLVGDSFTQGLGARPWFYDLERELPSLPLANLGVVGMGVQHWAKAINWFDKSIARVDRVVVIFITDDFFRPYWNAKVTQDYIAFCYEERCGKAYAKLYERHPDALIEEWYQPMDEPYDTKEQIKEKVLEAVLKFRVGRVLINLRRSFLRSWDRRYLEPSKKSFEQLLKTHNLAMVVHIPEKYEAYSQKWSTDSREVGAFIEQTGLSYIDGLNKCRLNANDYREFDSHPNEFGYQKIKACVGELLNAQIVLLK